MRLCLREITLAEAGRRLPSLVREMEAEPDIGDQIKVHPTTNQGHVNSRGALLRAVRKAEKRPQFFAARRGSHRLKVPRQFPVGDCFFELPHFPLSGAGVVVDELVAQPGAGLFAFAE